MSPVELKKTQCRPVKFKGQGPRGGYKGRKEGLEKRGG